MRWSPPTQRCSHPGRSCRLKPAARARLPHARERAAVGLRLRALRWSSLAAPAGRLLSQSRRWLFVKVGVPRSLRPRRLLADEGFRKDLLSRVAKTGAAIEDALGSAQDVEGCVAADGAIFVVQTRPQV